MPDPVRLAFVGTGGRSISEMLELTQMEGVALAGFCDVAPDRCAAALREVNAALARAGRSPIEVPFFGDAGAMVAATKPDGVYVSVPPFAHGPAEHAALDAGCALFVEKPVALEMALGMEIAEHARAAGVVTCVGYQLRYTDTAARARALLAGRAVGMALATRFGDVPGAPWWRVDRQGGGMLVEQHTHGVDMLRFLVGDVETVYAQEDTRLLAGRADLPGLDIPDVEAATLRFASGAIGVVADSCALIGGVRLPGAGGTQILAQGLGLSLGGPLQASFEGGQVEQLPGTGPCDRRLNEAFVQAIRTGDRSAILSDYDEGLATFAVTYACRVSARQGRPVRIAELYEG